MSFIYDSIIEKYPNLYRTVKYIECNTGWSKIIDELSAKLEEEIIKLEEPELYCCSQVKEKYGTLRFYMHCETDVISKLIREAENLSSKTCEVCGNHGTMRNGTWIYTLCDEHAA